MELFPFFFQWYWDAFLSGFTAMLKVGYYWNGSCKREDLIFWWYLPHAGFGLGGMKERKFWRKKKTRGTVYIN